MCISLNEFAEFAALLTASHIPKLIENLLQFEIPRRARYIRLIIAELERIHSHLLWLGLVGYWTGFDTLFMWIWKDREHVLDLVETITGNRIHKSYSTISGVRRDLPDNIGEPLRKEMKYIEGEIRILQEPSFQRRDPSNSD